MEINQASLYITKLPLKKPFKHGSFEREYNDTVFLELKDDFNAGFGESLPREYVTGENSGQVIESLKRYISKIPKEFVNLEEIADFLNQCEHKDSRNMASLCGLDMALLDLYGKNKGKSLSQLLCEELNYKKTKEPRITSGPLGLDTPNWKKNFYCLAGIKDIKLKITPETNPEKIYKMRNGFIKPKTFRLDGNCSLTPDELAGILINARSKIDYIEQPFEVGVENPKWKGIKFLADESLISIKDAKTIGFDSASIRIGKNGGILRTLDIIKEWEKRGKPYMLGSLVGETSLLSAALLHVASITNPFLIEGCYSNRILEKDPTDIYISFGYKGKVKFNYARAGLGVNLDLRGIETKKIELI